MIQSRSYSASESIKNSGLTKDLVRLGVIIATILTVVLSHAITATTAEAAQPLRVTSIIIEKSCQLSSNCVSYSDIKFLDNSPKTVGVLDVKGVRHYTPKQDNIEWLRFYNYSMVLVNAPPKITDKSKTITIKTQLDMFFKPTQYTVKEYNSTNYNATRDAKPTQSVRSFSHSWDVDPSCRNAVISGKEWQTLLPQIISYLDSGCTEKIQSNVSQEIKPITKTPLITSYKYKQQLWLDIIKKDCLQKRNACTDLKQPTRGGL